MCILALNVVKKDIARVPSHRSASSMNLGPRMRRSGQWRVRATEDGVCQIAWRAIQLRAARDPQSQAYMNLPTVWTVRTCGCGASLVSSPSRTSGSMSGVNGMCTLDVVMHPDPQRVAVHILGPGCLLEQPQARCLSDPDTLFACPRFGWRSQLDCAGRHKHP
ncbi:hypothetical protein GY45DRAFT_323185 [Cubamyces sp. BRFM 1775]|nr:hypothetical protein GY45DRAFT_323185 [Cubamyces sp. BRFM 1775]